MSTLLKVGLVFAASAFSGLLALPACAANWHTNGLATFSFTNAGAARVIIHPSAGGMAVFLQCSAAGASFTINGPTSAALPWLHAATVTPAFGGTGNCMVSGVLGYTVACSLARFRANSYSGGDTLGTAGGGITTGEISGIDCRLTAGRSTCSTITGSVTAQYTNPNPLASGQGQLTLLTSGQSLTVGKIGPGCAAVAHGTGTLGSVSGAGIADLTYLVDGPAAPYLYRGT